MLVVSIAHCSDSTDSARADSGGGGGVWGLQPPQMILRSPAHLGLKYESRPLVFLTGP